MGMVVISNSFVSGSVDCKLTSAGRSDAETPSSLVKSTFDKKIMFEINFTLHTKLLW